MVLSLWQDHRVLRKIKTRLEVLLEEELALVRILLRDRIYNEDFLVATEIDNAVNPIPDKMTEEMEKELTDYQRMLIEDIDIPLFRREAYGKILKLVDFRDIRIATIASTRGFYLKTKNKKHFERIKNTIRHHTLKCVV